MKGKKVVLNFIVYVCNETLNTLFHEQYIFNIRLEWEEIFCNEKTFKEKRQNKKKRKEKVKDKREHIHFDIEVDVHTYPPYVVLVSTSGSRATGIDNLLKLKTQI